MQPLSDIGMQELVLRIRNLEAENDRLRRVIASALCGDICGSVSCQLVRGHEGLHAWSEPTSDLVCRW